MNDIYRQTYNRTTGEILSDEKVDDPERRSNSDFVMMYRNFIKNVADLGDQNPGALRAFLCLVRYMDYRNAIIISTQTLGGLLKVSRQTAGGYLKFLVNTGFLYSYPVGTGKAYVVNPDVVWSAYDRQKGLCHFKADVVLDPDLEWPTYKELVKQRKAESVRHIDEKTFGLLKAQAKAMDDDESELPEVSNG